MPSIAVKKPYEAVYIVDPALGEEQVSAITRRYQQIIEQQGGTVEKLDVWERRKLAYEIKGRTEGIYVVMQFTGEPKVEVELRRNFQISEDQIRYLIVKPEETDDAQARDVPAERPAYAPARQFAPQAAEEPQVSEEMPPVSEPEPESAEAEPLEIAA